MSGYTEPELVDCVMTLLDLIKRPGLEESRVFKKFASPQFMRGSEYVRDFVKKHGW